MTIIERDLVPMIQAPFLMELAGTATDTKGRAHPLTSVVYQPFSPLELAAFTVSQAYPEPTGPTALAIATLFETFFATHNPTWMNIQILLNTLVIAEEKAIIISTAHQHGEQLAAHQGGSQLDEIVPLYDPRWDQA